MYARLNPLPHESVFAAVARWAAGAPVHLLQVLGWSGLVGSAGVFLIDPGRWYLGVGLMSVATLGWWGLIEHRLDQRRTAGLRLLVLTVATLAVLFAFTAILVSLFVFLGPAPHF